MTLTLTRGIPRFEDLESRLLLNASTLASPEASPINSSWLSQQLTTPHLLGRAPSATDDYGSAILTAATLTLSSSGAASKTAKINYSGDVDVFAMVATVTGSMQIKMNAATRSKAINSELTIYDGVGIQVVYNNDSGGTKNSTVNLAVTAGQTYFIKAAGYSSTTGSYNLLVSTTPAQPPVTPEPPPDPVVPDPTPEPPVTPPVGGYTPGAIISGLIQSTINGLQLVILGTDLADTITLCQVAAGVTMTTALGSQDFTGTFCGIEVYGFAGSDTIRTDHTVTVSATIYGGDGNDQIFEAGTAASKVYGDAGDDLLVTVGGGNDTVYGGDGTDSFWANSADTLSDVVSAETAAKTVHKIAQFYQPTSDPAQAVSIEIAGQKIVDPQTPYTYVDFSSRPLFVDGPEYNDVIQGGAGDCYLMATLSSLAQSDPNIISQLIAPMGDGTYAVRFYRNSQEIYLRLDGELPTCYGWIQFAGLTPDGELWVSLVEKAYAQFRSGQNSYASLTSGWMTTVYTEITGLSASTVYTSTLSDSALVSWISSNMDAGHAISAGSYSTASTPITPSHGYVVRSVQSISGAWSVTVYNVWGNDGNDLDGNAADGLVTLSVSQFKQLFECFSLSQA